MGTSTDPLSLHKYLYANSDPADFVDLSGKFPLGGLLNGIRTIGLLARTSSGRAFLFESAKPGAGQALASREAGFLVLAALSAAGMQVIKWLDTKTKEDDDGPDETYFHGTISSSRASKILKRGFKEVPTYFAEDKATARHFAMERAAASGTMNIRIPTLTIPRSVRIASGMTRLPVGEDAGLKPVDIPGETGFEWVVGNALGLEVINGAILTKQATLH